MSNNFCCFFVYFSKKNILYRIITTRSSKLNFTQMAYVKIIEKKMIFFTDIKIMLSKNEMDSKLWLKTQILL